VLTHDREQPASSAPGIPARRRVPRPALSPEERERKKAEREARRAEEAEQVREAKNQRREKKWRENNYASHVLPESDSEDSDVGESSAVPFEGSLAARSEVESAELPVPEAVSGVPDSQEWAPLPKNMAEFFAGVASPAIGSSSAAVSETPDLSLATVPADEIQDVDDDDKDDGEHRRAELHYATGSVLTPQVPATLVHPQRYRSGEMIVMHYVDASGTWGRGGLFDSIAGQHTWVKDAYELAGQMRDLQLGQVHLFPVTANVHVALLVVINLRPQRCLDEEAFAKALITLGKRARKGRALVHTPRFGGGLADFVWYRVERKLRQVLCEQFETPVVIYYLPRGERVRAGSLSSAAGAASADDDQRRHTTAGAAPSEADDFHGESKRMRLTESQVQQSRGSAAAERSSSAIGITDVFAEMRAFLDDGLASQVRCE
jgi:hypothetical protein